MYYCETNLPKGDDQSEIKNSFISVQYTANTVTGI